MSFVGSGQNNSSHSTTTSVVKPTNPFTRSYNYDNGHRRSFDNYGNSQTENIIIQQQDVQPIFDSAPIVEEEDTRTPEQIQYDAQQLLFHLRGLGPNGIRPASGYVFPDAETYASRLSKMHALEKQIYVLQQQQKEKEKNNISKSDNPNKSSYFIVAFALISGMVVFLWVSQKKPENVQTFL